MTKGAGQTEPSLPNEKVPCVVCREPILRGAKVCNHCKRSQDWTRYLIRGSTFVGAAVAVLSLVSAAYSLTELIVVPAELSVLSKACTNESLELAVTNLGDRPAMLTRVALRLRLGGDITEKSMKLTAVQGEEIVAPHATQKITYARMVAGTSASLSDASANSENCAYIVGIETVDFEDNEKNYVVDCPCPAM